MENMHACPYWKDTKKNQKTGVITEMCEACELSFAKLSDLIEYRARHCCHNPGWQKCSIAHQLNISKERDMEADEDLVLKVRRLRKENDKKRNQARRKKEKRYVKWEKAAEEGMAQGKKEAEN